MCPVCEKDVASHNLRLNEPNSFCLNSCFLTVHLWLGEEPPPTGPSAGEDNSPQELPTAQLHRIHFCSRLAHTHRCVQEKRQNHQSTHAVYLTALMCCSPKPAAASLFAL